MFSERERQLGCRSFLLYGLEDVPFVSKRCSGCVGIASASGHGKHYFMCFLLFVVARQICCPPAAGPRGGSSVERRMNADRRRFSVTASGGDSKTAEVRLMRCLVASLESVGFNSKQRLGFLLFRVAVLLLRKPALWSARASLLLERQKLRQVKSYGAF